MMNFLTMKLKKQEEYITELQNKNDELAKANAELVLLVASFEALSRAQKETLVAVAKELNRLKREELMRYEGPLGFKLH